MYVDLGSSWQTGLSTNLSLVGCRGSLQRSLHRPSNPYKLGGNRLALGLSLRKLHIAGIGGNILESSASVSVLSPFEYSFAICSTVSKHGNIKLLDALSRTFMLSAGHVTDVLLPNERIDYHLK